MIDFQRLKDIKEDNDINQETMSQILGLPRSTYSMWELGISVIPLKLLCDFADYFNITLDYALNKTSKNLIKGLGFQVTDLNPFLKSYYKSLKGEEIQEALANTSGSIRTWEKLIKSFEEKLKDENLSPQEREIMEQTVEDTEYQIKTAKEIERLLLNTNVDDFREREKDKNEEDNR